MIIKLSCVGILSSILISCSSSSDSTAIVSSRTTVSPSGIGPTLNPNPAGDQTTTTADPMNVPSWISPDSLRSEYFASLQLKVSVSQMSDSELVSAPLVAHSDVFTPLNPSASFFSDGIFVGVSMTMQSVINAWIRLDFLNNGVDCLNFITLYYVQRPVWYTASLDEIASLRICMDIAKNMVDSVNMQSNEDIGAALVIVSCLKDWISVAYSPKTELAMRKQSRLTDKIADWESKIITLPLFTTYVNQHPGIKALIENIAPSIVSIPNLDYLDSEYLARVSTGKASNVHMADFIDYVWSSAALVNNGQAMDSLWSYMYNNVNEGDIFNFDSKKVIPNTETALSIRMTHYRVGMGAARGSWLATVGRLLGTLYNRSPQGVMNCLPIGFDKSTIPPDLAQLFYYLSDENLKSLLPMYRCITDGIDAGTIIFENDSGANLGVLMHLIRMTTSAIALAIDNI